MALADGTFWISDEYGPHILHVNSEGRTIERINPFTTGRALPKVLAKRWPNRGMEGLTITPDNKMLVGIMQSTLDNPNNKVRATSHVTRIVTFDIASGKTQQFIYPQEAPKLANSEITALSQTEFLVIERDTLFEPKAKVKRIYKIDISQATDVSDPQNGANGLMFDGKTLEQMSLADLKAKGIQPVSKRLVTDLLNRPQGYPCHTPVFAVSCTYWEKSRGTRFKAC